MNVLSDVELEEELELEEEGEFACDNCDYYTGSLNSHCGCCEIGQQMVDDLLNSW